MKCLSVSTVREGRGSRSKREGRRGEERGGILIHITWSRKNREVKGERRRAIRDGWRGETGEGRGERCLGEEVERRQSAWGGEKEKWKHCLKEGREGGERKEGRLLWVECDCTST